MEKITNNPPRLIGCASIFKEVFSDCLLAFQTATPWTPCPSVRAARLDFAGASFAWRCTHAGAPLCRSRTGVSRRPRAPARERLVALRSRAEPPPSTVKRKKPPRLTLVSTKFGLRQTCRLRAPACVSRDSEPDLFHRMFSWSGDR
jgi:hypothetical protein